jgi:hypothetical protein
MRCLDHLLVGRQHQLVLEQAPARSLVRVELRDSTEMSAFSKL